MATGGFDKDAERLLLYGAGLLLGIWLLPKVIGSAASGATRAIVDLANNVGVSISDSVFNTLNPPDDGWTVPTSAHDAQLRIAADPESFPLSEVVKAVNNLENSGVMIGSDQMGKRILPFITGNRNFFTAAQVSAALSALTGW